MATDFDKSKFYVINKKFLVGFVLFVIILVLGIIWLVNAPDIYVCDKHDGTFMEPGQNINLVCKKVR